VAGAATPGLDGTRWSVTEGVTTSRSKREGGRLFLCGLEETISGQVMDVGPFAEDGGRDDFWFCEGEGGCEVRPCCAAAARA
jgi:hypothetical protein